MPGPERERSSWVQFEYEGNLWPIVDEWAREDGYRLKKDEKDRRVYTRGRDILIAPRFLIIEKQGILVSVEAYIKPHPISGYEFETIGLNSAGGLPVMSRDKDRAKINRLLVRLNAPLIP